MSKSLQNHLAKDETAFWLLNPASKIESFLLCCFFLLLPTQLGKHFWPDFSLVHGILIDYLSPTIYLTDLLLGLLLLIRLIHLLRHPHFAFSFVATLIVSSIFLGLLGMSLLTHSPVLSLYGLLKLIEYSLFGLYLAKTIQTQKQLSHLGIFLAIGALYSSLLAFLQYSNQASINGFWYYLGERTFTGGTPGIANVSLNGDLLLRPYATFPHPNVLAGYLLLSIIFIWFFVLPARKPWQQVLGGITILVSSVALLLTFSRIAILLWFIALALVGLKLIYRKQKPRWWEMVLGLCFIVALCFGSLSSELVTRFLGTSLTEEAVTQRVVLFHSAFQMIQAHWLTGVGLLQFIPSLGPLQAPLSIGLYFQPVHTIYLIVAAETGVLGLLFFLGFLSQTVNHLRQNNPKVLLPFGLMLSAILIIGLFDHYWLTLQQGQLLFATVLGLCWTTIKK